MVHWRVVMAELGSEPAPGDSPVTSTPKAGRGMGDHSLNNSQDTSINVTGINSSQEDIGLSTNPQSGRYAGKHGRVGITHKDIPKKQSPVVDRTSIAKHQYQHQSMSHGFSQPGSEVNGFQPWLVGQPMPYHPQPQGDQLNQRQVHPSYHMAYHQHPQLQQQLSPRVGMPLYDQQSQHNQYYYQTVNSTNCSNNYNANSMAVCKFSKSLMQTVSNNSSPISTLALSCVTATIGANDYQNNRVECQITSKDEETRTDSINGIGNDVLVKSKTEELVNTEPKETSTTMPTMIVVTTTCGMTATAGYGAHVQSKFSLLNSDDNEGDSV